MNKIEKKTSRSLKKNLFQAFSVSLILMASSYGWASPGETKATEMTPGPRMIRAVEALSHDILAAEEALRLTPEQIESVQKAVTELKVDIWRKEAILLGMFEKISLKRRHGLLGRGDYQASNQLTGGIETDEMGRMIKAIRTLQEILSPKQKEVFQAMRKPSITLKYPEGFNTRIGLLALGRISRAYGLHRDDLDLSEAQKIAIRELLGTARREVIEIGTQIELSRMEAYDLLKEPRIDPKVVQKAMLETAQLEGVFFPKLSEYSKKFEEILSPEQRSILKHLGKRKSHARSPHGSRHHASDPSVFYGKKSTASFLDQAHALRLSRAEIEALVALEISTLEKLKSNEVELKIERLALEELIKDGAEKEVISAQIERIAERVAAVERIHLSKHFAGLKIINSRIKLTFHHPRTDSETNDGSTKRSYLENAKK